MPNKDQLRKRFYKIRKKNYFETTNKHFGSLLLLIKNFSKKKNINLSCYYPSNFEFCTLSLIKILSYKKNITTLLPSAPLVTDEVGPPPPVMT